MAVSATSALAKAIRTVMNNYELSTKVYSVLVKPCIRYSIRIIPQMFLQVR